MGIFQTHLFSNISLQLPGNHSTVFKMVPCELFKVTKASTLLSKRSFWFVEACARDNDGMEEVKVEFNVTLPVVGLQEGSRPEPVGQEQDEHEHKQNTSRHHQQLHLCTRLKKNTHMNSDPDRGEEAAAVGLGRFHRLISALHSWSQWGLLTAFSSITSRAAGVKIMLMYFTAALLINWWATMAGAHLWSTFGGRRRGC